MIADLTVRVPATVANVGPGFDALAFAVERRNEIRVQPSSELAVTVEGEGAGAIPLDETNLVVRAMTRVLGAPPRAAIHLVNRVPVGRGLGSSAAAIVGGLVAASAMRAEAPGTDLLAAAIDIEGHADNVTACLLGGFTVSLAGAPPARLAMPEAWHALLLVAPEPLDTGAARRALPASVTFDRSARSVGRAARLVAAIASGDAGALLAATEDELHQPARFGLAPAAGDLVRELRGRGVPAFLSGAGPSVAAIVAGPRDDLGDIVARFAPEGWEPHYVPFAARGAEVVEAT